MFVIVLFILVRFTKTHYCRFEILFRHPFLSSVCILQQDDNVHCFTASLLALWPACFGGKGLYLLVIRYLVTRDISQLLMIYSIETYGNHCCVLADDKLMFIDFSYFLLTHVTLFVNNKLITYPLVN